MFETDETGRSALSALFAEEGHNSWDYVTLGLFVPWWIVTIESNEGEEGRWYKTILVKAVQQIHALGSRADVCLKRIQMVQPDPCEAGGWELYEVVKINVSTEEKKLSGDSIEIIQYELSNGEKRTCEKIKEIQHTVGQIFPPLG